MNRFRKMVLKALSSPYKNLKKYYKLQRSMLNAINLYFRPIHKMVDLEIMAGDRKIPIRIFQPGKNASRNRTHRVLVFFHGGGWVTGNIDTYTKTCDYMAKKTKSMVISVDYLLAPENPFPAGLEDCYLAAGEIFLHHDLLQCKAEDITLIGDSAGGNLAAAVSLLARDRGSFSPKKQILIYPSTYNDHSENSPFPSIRENGTDYIMTSQQIQDYMDMYLQSEEDKTSPYAAPLLAKDLSRQPQTLIITAEFDPLRDEGEAYGMRLKESGNRVVLYRMKDAIHGFFSLPWKSKKVKKCYNVINRFLNEEHL